MVQRNNETNRHVGYFGWSKEEKIDFLTLRSPRLSKLPSPESSQLESNHFTFNTDCYTHLLATRLQERVKRIMERSVSTRCGMKDRILRLLQSVRTAFWRRKNRLCS